MRTGEYHREKAKELLRHHFELAGVLTMDDNRVEIDEIVDHVIEAAVDAVAERARLRGQC